MVWLHHRQAKAEAIFLRGLRVDVAPTKDIVDRRREADFDLKIYCDLSKLLDDILAECWTSKLNIC